MKIFVTGSTGSIGQHLVKMLAARDHTIHVLVRSAEKARHLTFPNVKFFSGDLSDMTSVENAMRGCNQVYHLAAFAKVWSPNSADYYAINVRGTINVLEAAVRNNVNRVVVTSTAGVLGPSINGIITEDKVRDIDFFNEYEGSKAMAESRIKDFVNQYGLDVVIVSPSRVYGPSLFGAPTSTTLLIDKYVNGSWRIYPGTGKEFGNYVYVEDVALGHILAMEKGLKGHTYLLGGENHNYISFFSALREVSGVKRTMLRVPVWVQFGIAHLQLLCAKYFAREPAVTPKWVSKGRYDWELSPLKAVRELGLPITPLKEGLQKTVEYVRRIRK